MSTYLRMMLLDEESFGVNYLLPEFKTFRVANEKSYFNCDWNYIKLNYPEHVDAILNEIKVSQGKSGYIGIGSAFDLKAEYFEIQWD